ncbi:hypothetical protein RQP46_006686 [Phenoliferia psychrophenolica]
MRANLLRKGPFKDSLRSELALNGYTVVKAAIPLSRALAYRDRAHEWLEGFGLGYDRTDESTFTDGHLPPHIKGGMFSECTTVAHSRWVWDVRTQAFLYNFDGVSSAYLLENIVENKVFWMPHMDQSPNRSGFFVAQGLVNLNYNGINDGGLMVLKGSSRLMEEYFDTFPEEKANGNSWGPADWYGFSDEQQKWFFGRGCEWVKVTAEPGDLILWDSRSMHYNRRPTGDIDRVCTYVCMAPIELLNDADRATKQQLFKTSGATTHNPFENIFIRPKSDEGGAEGGPIADPSAAMLKLSAMLPY